MTTIGDNIKAIKSFYGISRQTLHLISGISADALKRYERGEEAPRKYQLLIGAMLNVETFNTLFQISKSRLHRTDCRKITNRISAKIKVIDIKVREYRSTLMSIKIENDDN